MRSVMKTADRTMISDVVDILQDRLQRPSLERRRQCGISHKGGFACAVMDEAPERRHEADAGNPSDAQRWKGRRKMGDGVTGAGNTPPASQMTNAGQGGAQSQADAAKFG